MKINLSASDKDKMHQLFETKENNIQISEMMNYLLENIDAFNKKEILDYQNEYNCSLEKAYFHYAIDLWELDYQNSDNQKIFKEYLNNSFLQINKKEYESNPYYKNIKIKEIKNKNYHLFYDHYKAYEPFPLTDILVNQNNYLEETKFGFFTDEFPFIALTTDNTTWMSITPNEINTMKESIDKANGNVVVLGLGLGYFPYMISLKNNVKTIKIIEKDSQIIDIFKNNIFPMFENKNKINLIKDDAFNYLKKIDNVDFIYVDLYHNPIDALPIYIKTKRIENNLKNVHFEYWLETGILAYIRRLAITLIQESELGYKDNQYLKEKCEEDKFINELYFKTKNISFNSYEEIINFLTDDNLKKVII